MPLTGALGAMLAPERAGSLGAEGRMESPLDACSLGAVLGRRAGSPGPATGAKLTPLRLASSRNSDSPAARAPAGALRLAAGGGMAGAPVRTGWPGGRLD